jgi:hypothetical protein
MSTERSLNYFTRINKLGESARVRCTIERGQVQSFTVQYEPWIEGRFRPVVRYDNAHGVSHRDILSWDGDIVRKDWDWTGATLEAGDAMNLALTELRRDWATYKADFLRRKP